MSGPRADADLARSNRCRHTTLALERFGYWSVKTRAFDGRDVDGTEQPVRRLPCRLGQATVPGPENGRDRSPPPRRPHPGESKYDRASADRPTRVNPGPQDRLSGTKGAPEGRQQFPPVPGETRRQTLPAPSGLGISAQYWPESHLQNGPRRGNPGSRGHSSPALRPASSTALTPADGWADSPDSALLGPRPRRHSPPPMHLTGVATWPRARGLS
jgi:hypothetical protein